MSIFPPGFFTLLIKTVLYFFQIKVCFKKYIYIYLWKNYEQILSYYLWIAPNPVFGETELKFAKLMIR